MFSILWFVRANARATGLRRGARLSDGAFPLPRTPDCRAAVLASLKQAVAVQQSGAPMTYALNGRQYIVVAIAGPGRGGELVAYRLRA